MTDISFFARFLNDFQLRRNYSLKPAGLKWRSNKVLIVITVGVALWTDLLLYVIVVPILPFLLQDRIGVPDEQVQSYTSALLAVFAGTSALISPLAGFLADGISTRQAPFLSGLFAMFVATFLLRTGQSIFVLLLARILQGISAAFVWTVGMALCLETVGFQDLGKTLGTIFSFISVAPLIGPVLGGILYEKAGSNGVFGFAFAVLALDFILRLLVIEVKVARRYGHDNPRDNSPNGTVSAEEACEESTTVNAQTPLVSGKPNRWIISQGLPEFCRYPPILPCLADSRLVVALFMTLVQATILGSFDATVPTIARDYYGFSSLETGLLFLPLAISHIIMGPLCGWFVDRYGTKPVAVIGYIYLAPALFLLRLAQPGDMREVYIHGGLLAVCGIGIAAVGAPSVVEAGYVVEQYYQNNQEFFNHQAPYAQLYGLNNIAFSLGLTIGPELAGELKQLIGYGNMNAVLSIVSALTAILAWIYIGG